MGDKGNHYYRMGGTNGGPDNCLSVHTFSTGYTYCLNDFLKALSINTVFLVQDKTCTKLGIPQRPLCRLSGLGLGAP